MGRFRVTLSRASSSIGIETDHCDLEGLGLSLQRERFLVGVLIEEGGQTLSPPVRVLLPVHRIDLVSEDAGDL